METSIEGDCHEASDSKSSGSELRRSGLSIDLNLPLPVFADEEDCQPFSIRLVSFVILCKPNIFLLFSFPFGSLNYVI